MRLSKEILKKEVIYPRYKWESFYDYDQLIQHIWQSIRDGKIIDLDCLESKHVLPFVKDCLRFFTGDKRVTIYFQSSKKRLGIVKKVTPRNFLHYKCLGKEGTISYGKLYE